MDKITDIVYITIRELIQKSKWGQEVTTDKLLKYLYDETDEFAESCRRKNNENIYEEAADVLMILLYIVIKEQNDIKGNPIEIILNNIEKKLKKRYSVFFEGIEDEDEEEHWKQTKYLEKEVLDYIYCANPNCSEYLKVNKGNVRFEDNNIICDKCGYIEKSSGKNLLLPRKKKRRVVLEKLKWHFEEYMKERKAAQNYYINEKNDYYSIMRYIITYPLGYEVIKDYCKGRFDSIDEEMDSFLVQPIRDYMQDMKSDLEDGKLSLNMNDMMINSINYNYNELKKLVCYSNCKTNMVLLQKYLVKLFSSMQHKVSKLIDGYIVDSQNVKEKDIIQKYRCELGEHGVVNIIKYEKNNKLVTACKLFFDVEMCISNCDILQALVSVILQLDLQHYSNLEILILNLPDKLVSIELRDLISDIFPQVSCQLILTVKQSEKNAFLGNNIGLQVGQDSIEKVSTILKKLGEHDEKVFLMLNDCILLKCEEICRAIKKYINNYELYFIKTEDKELAKKQKMSLDKSEVKYKIIEW